MRRRCYLQFSYSFPGAGYERLKGTGIAETASDNGNLLVTPGLGSEKREE
jgi:single-stranded DNA-specific DHH superfamily exonuclease